MKTKNVKFFYLWKNVIEDDSNFFWGLSSNGGCYSVTRTIHFFTDKKSFYKLTLYKDSSEFFTDSFGHYCLPSETNDIHFNDIDIDLNICEQSCYLEKYIQERSIEYYLKRVSMEEALYSTDVQISSRYDSDGRDVLEPERIAEPLNEDVLNDRKNKLRKLGFKI